jgi:hypothetical protein
MCLNLKGENWARHLSYRSRCLLDISSQWTPSKAPLIVPILLLLLPPTLLSPTTTTTSISSTTTAQNHPPPCPHSPQTWQQWRRSSLIILRLSQPEVSINVTAQLLQRLSNAGAMASAVWSSAVANIWLGISGMQR